MVNKHQRYILYETEKELSTASASSEKVNRTPSHLSFMESGKHEII